MKAHILVVEDEVKIATLIRDYLFQSDYDCTLIHHGDEVKPWLAEHNPSLILLDLMLPGTDGLSLCSYIRRSSDIPIIMLTARVEEIDRLLGLELGADDYICKPFSTKEVVARIKAVLRRSNNSNFNALPIGLNINTDHCLLSYNTNSITLTSIEIKLMQIMIEKPGRIYSRDSLMANIYPDQRIVSDRTIDSHIKKLRKKIKLLLPEREIIHSVYGVGYKFEW